MLANWQTAGILPSPYLVAGWKMDGNSLDMSGNNHHGTDYNITYGAGIYGQAAEFNGTSGYIEMADTAQTTGLPQTVCLWLYRSGAGIIFSRAINYDPSGLYIFSNDFAWLQAQYRKVLSSVGFFPANTWFHLSIVFLSSSYFYVYINGILAATLTAGASSSFLGYGAKTKLGAYDASNDGNISGYMTGKMDSVYIFNVALSQPDIVRVMNNQNPTYIP
jgi:hypothetical protein